MGCLKLLTQLHLLLLRMCSVFPSTWVSMCSSRFLPASISALCGPPKRMKTLILSSTSSRLKSGKSLISVCTDPVDLKQSPIFSFLHPENPEIEKVAINRSEEHTSELQS